MRQPFEWSLLNVDREMSRLRLWPVRIYGVVIVIQLLTEGIPSLSGEPSVIVGQFFGMMLASVLVYFGLLYLLSAAKEQKSDEQEEEHIPWGDVESN